MLDGSLKYREDVVEGLENAPAALIGILGGRKFGKLLAGPRRPGSDPSPDAREGIRPCTGT